jgi:NADPH2:quinone reductase
LGAADVEGLASARNVRAANINGAATSETIAQLAALVSRGELRIPISARYPLEVAADALAAFQAGSKRGKIVLEMTA